MSTPFDSVYPDFLRAGLGRLNQAGAQRELLSLFAALEHFRRDLHAQESVAGILQVSQMYVAGLDLFRVSGFYLVNTTDFGFELALCSPEAGRAELEEAVTKEIRAGRFAQALRRASPIFFHAGSGASPGRGVMHGLAVSNQVLGTFCGLLQDELAPVHEIAFSLLSMLLGGSADALAHLRKTAQLTDEIKTLSGLMPICAWCKKVRDDQGYWEQIEQFVQNRSGASFSHGICPDCAQRLFHI